MSALKTLPILVGIAVTTFSVSTQAQPSEASALSALPIGVVSTGPLATLGPLMRLGARATAANIAFDDLPNDKRFSDRIDTLTVDSVFAWLQRSGPGGARVTVRTGSP